MAAERKTTHSKGDSLKFIKSKRPLPSSANNWIILQALTLLNQEESKGAKDYKHVVETMSKCQKEISESIINLYSYAKSGDVPFRWGLLYLLGDVANPKAAKFLAEIALQKLPDSDPDGCCESMRDMEILISTMAIHALGKGASRHPEVSKYLMKIISAKPSQPILIEAVKMALVLGKKSEVKQILEKQHHWMLDLKRAKKDELTANSERKDEREVGHIPPKVGVNYTAPAVKKCNCN